MRWQFGQGAGVLQVGGSKRARQGNIGVSWPNQTPDTSFVELMTNGDHVGTYTMAGIPDDRNLPDRLPGFAADLVRRPVAVIIANTDAAHAAKAATATIPIVFAIGGDPVKDGLVASLNRPAGNVTGVVFFNSVLGSKKLELLRQTMPRATAIALLMSPK
jgi:hypothetical protein